ncbi:MAG: right-handed parallel beta-helix repeat-containing protein [Luteolibacter sp.]
MKTQFSLFVFMFITVSPVAHGTVVTTFLDEDDGGLGGGYGISLREAVRYSASESTITFAPGLSGQTIRLPLGPLQIFKSLTIDASSLPGGLTLSADRTGNGKTADDTYVLLCSVGDLLLNSLTLTDANCGESAGCIKAYDNAQVALTLDHCTLTGNSGYHGAALYAYAYGSGSSITIRNSTFAQNSAVKGAAGINSYGFAVTIQNSTFTGNSGGAVYFSNGSLSINHATISGNTATSSGGGIFSLDPFSLQNSIVAGNTAPSAPNISGTFTGSHNLTSGSPRLAPLGDYGGPTKTMPPVPGSPAINAAWPPILTTDQRGFFQENDVPDIGAAEYQAAAELRRYWNLDFDGDGSPFGIEVGLDTDPLVPDATSPRNLTVSTLDPFGHPVIHFGYGSLPPYFSAEWVLKRSSTLSPGSFQEIYRFSSDSAAPQPGITYRRDSSGDTVTDTTAPAGGAFYRIEGISP